MLKELRLSMTIPLKLNSSRFGSVTVGGVKWSQDRPVHHVTPGTAERLRGTGYFREESRLPRGGDRGEALLFLRAGQAPTFWQIAKGLATHGVRPVFCEIHKPRTNDGANRKFLAARGEPMLSLAELEPSLRGDSADIPGYDLEEITRFARWRWARRGYAADAYLIARAAWLIPEIERLIAERDPMLVCTWGNMCHDSRAAIEVAKRRRVPYVLAEGGFFPNTLTVDSREMYFSRRSDFEDLWNESEPLSDEEEHHTTTFLSRWRESGLSKYNRPTRFQRRYSEFNCGAVTAGKKTLLVACQTTADATMYYPEVLLDGKDDLVRLACAALEGMSDWVALVKPHPHEEVGDDMREAIAQTSNAVLLENVSAQSAIMNADVVLTINSTLGLEALSHGKRVITLGDNIYTGRGLTTDVRSGADPQMLRHIVPAALIPDAGLLKRFLHTIIFKYLHHYDLPTGRMEHLIGQAESQHSR